MTSFLDRLLGRTEYAPTVADHEAASRASAHAAGPFRMTVEDVFTITGRGTVATGTIDAGSISVGDGVQVETAGFAPATGRVAGVEAFRKVMTTANAGDHVGVLFEDPSPVVERGSILSGATVTQ